MNVLHECIVYIVCIIWMKYTYIYIYICIYIYIYMHVLFQSLHPAVIVGMGEPLGCLCLLTPHWFMPTLPSRTDKQTTYNVFCTLWDWQLSCDVRVFVSCPIRRLLFDTCSLKCNHLMEYITGNNHTTWYMPNLPTNIVDVRGFDSIIILI